MLKSSLDVLIELKYVHISVMEKVKLINLNNPPLPSKKKSFLQIATPIFSMLGEAEIHAIFLDFIFLFIYEYMHHSPIIVYDYNVTTMTFKHFILPAFLCDFS
mmetsp:Transcript_28984/g.43119  ORF Transcript_28984/g.43119 Transcript_28984/m.43119 type:complete len:103 (-) Transcript_28984:397-705(-)